MLKIRIFMLMSAISLFAQAQAEELKIPSDKVSLMLEAINKIRSARDIKLGCKDYVGPFLGRSNSIKHYIDLFADHGVQPIKKYLNSKYYTWFDIGYSVLKDVKNSHFGRQDVLLIIFITEDQSDNSAIKSCSAILKAAPELP